MNVEILGGVVVRPDRDVDRADIQIVDGLISAVGTNLDPLPAGSSIFDATGLIVGPGWIDLQVNGGYGIDLASDPQKIPALAKQLPQHGITSWLPTLVSSPPEKQVEFASAVETTRRRQSHGAARCIGAHFEGPLLSPAYAGAHDLHTIEASAASDSESRVPSSAALITVAPEHTKADAFIANAVNGGAVVSIGHTGASAEQVHGAADRGATYATHLFNAMAPMHHRAPGPAGAVLADERYTAGLIADGAHLADDLLRICWSVLGPDRTSLVSDATAALGVPPGTYRLADRTVRIDVDGSVRTNTGELAGTAVGLDHCVRHLIETCKADLADVLASVTTTPARLLGLVDRAYMSKGLLGDVTLLDANHHVVATIIGGSTVHNTEPPRLSMPASELWK